MGGYEGSRLTLLGGFQLECAGQRVSLPANGQRLLAFLGVTGASPRSVTAGTLWPEVTEQNAYGSLRTTMWRLRRGHPRLIDSSANLLSLHPGVGVDGRVLADAAQAAVRPGGPADVDEVLMRGAELLPGWYDDWVIFERERLRQLRLHALEAIAGRLAGRGEYGRALQAALETVRAEPLRESAHRLVIAIHLAEHNVVEAIRHYRYVRDLMRAELGIPPSAGLTAMLPDGVRTGGPGRAAVTPR